jgi:hypothetical protein
MIHVHHNIISVPIHHKFEDISVYLQAHEEFVRMRQCIVRYAPNSAVYTRQCYEYLLSRMSSASIHHFSKRSRMHSAKGILGCLPLAGTYDYPSYFHLPYGQL